MKKMFLCLVALMLPVSALAHNPPQTERVYLAAKEICPIAARLGKPGLRYMLNEATNRGLNDDDKIILASMCMMYAQGVIDALSPEHNT